MKNLWMGVIALSSVSAFAGDPASYENEAFDSIEVASSCSVPGYTDSCRGRSFHISGCSISCSAGRHAECQQGRAHDNGADCVALHSNCYCL